MPIFLFQSSKTLLWIALDVGRLENELSTKIQYITKKHIMNSVGGSRVGPLLALLRPASGTRSAFTPTGESDAKITPARRDHRAGTQSFLSFATAVVHHIAAAIFCYRGRCLQTQRSISIQEPDA